MIFWIVFNCSLKSYSNKVTLLLDFCSEVALAHPPSNELYCQLLHDKHHIDFWQLCFYFLFNYSYRQYCVSPYHCKFYSWRIPGFVTRLTQRLSLVEQELPTLPEHMSSPPDFSGIRVTPPLVLCVCFVDCPFSLGHCVVGSSLIYRFWLPLWYIQTLLIVL